MKSPYAAIRRHVQCAIGLFALLLAVAAPVQAALPSAGNDTRQTILVMGDSLSAAYGLAAGQGWVALTAQRIAEQHPDWRVVNASISGETTAGGASRIVTALARHRPEVVVIELGANDGLRGLPVGQTRRNLAYMIGAAHGAGARVLLVGMQMPPNYGTEYTQAFADSYGLLAERFDIELLPFLLEPVAGERRNFQDDNLHPVAEAQPALRDHVWTKIAPMLD